MKRTHTCNELHAQHVGETVKLIGWIQSIRDHGGLTFIDLRDREGITQIVFDPQNDNLQSIKDLRDESVIEIIGIVSKRPENTINNRLFTGSIEVVANSITVHNICDVLPFPLDEKTDNVNEDLRLAYRYLDLRRQKNFKRLQVRHRITMAVRKHLDEQGFLEIETPSLFKTTPEGAREFLVPSRLNPGMMYALSQSPQQYKQILMVAGVEKYYQLARCFRDEDLRADRQPEFTQIDIEMSFIEREDIYKLIEGMLKRVWKESVDVDINIPFNRRKFIDAMNDYGCDKPDTRFEMKLRDLSKYFENSEFGVFASVIKNGGCIKAINAKGLADITPGELKNLENSAKSLGAKGLAFIRFENGQMKSPITKFLSENEINSIKTELNVNDGDIVFFAADKWEKACAVLARVRLECGALANQRGLINISPTQYNFLWVTDFPLMTFDEEQGRYLATHHPFTSPVDEDIQFLHSDPKNVHGKHYDIVLNGMELGGGSIRIHQPDVQKTVFEDVLKIPADVVEERFGYMLKAFKFGAPPHGGIALGLDRLAALLSQTTSIRDVIAFPKTQRGQDLMAQSPSHASDKQLKDLFIKTIAEE